MVDETVGMVVAVIIWMEAELNSASVAVIVIETVVADY